jgi:hypothetical protein
MDIAYFSNEVEFRQKIKGNKCFFCRKWIVNLWPVMIRAVHLPQDWRLRYRHFRGQRINGSGQQQEVPAYSNFFCFPCLPVCRSTYSLRLSDDSNDGSFLFDGIQAAGVSHCKCCGFRTLHYTHLFIAWNNCIAYQCRCRLCKCPQYTLDTQCSVLYSFCSICNLVLWSI